MAKKRQVAEHTFAIETIQANGNVITEMHSKILWYQMQMHNMQMQMQKMQMQMRMQTPVLHTTTVQVPSIPLTPLSETIRRNLYPLQLPLTQDSGLTLHSDLAPYSTHCCNAQYETITPNLTMKRI